MKKIIFLALLGLVFLSTAFAQSQKVSGVVMGDDGQPLIGATVYNKAAISNATTTDNKGAFSINVSATATLVVSYIGYKTQDYQLKGETSGIKITLSSGNASLSEVVVTALGIKKEKKSLGYAVTEVKGGELTEARSVNLANGLEGKVAGLNISPPATGANGSTRITIRGSGSISGNNQPLIVVDGVPINNDPSTLGPIVSWTKGDAQGYDKGDGISQLNPDEIETVSVLKGATAAALYGSRASNGAILITSKSAKAGQGVGVELGLNAAMETLLIPDLGYQTQYGHGTGGVKPATIAQAKAGRFSWGGKLDGSDAMFYDGVLRPYVAQDNNYGNFYQTGKNITSNVALTGSTESTKYRFSYSNVNYNGILPTNTTDRNNFALNLNSNLGKKLSILINTKYIAEKNHNRPRVLGEAGSSTFGILALPSTIPLSLLREKKYDANGYDNPWNDNLFTVNPYYGVEDFKENDKKNSIIGAIEPKWQITDWLYTKARFGLNYFNYTESEIIPYGTAYQLRGGLTIHNRTYNEQNTEFMIGANKNITKDINVNGIVGSNFLKQVTDGNDFSASNSFNIPFFYDLSNIDAANRTYSNAHIEKRINSVYGTAEVSYKSFLYLNASARNDWFSTLSSGKNSILYPSVGLSFVASEALKLPEVFNYLKIRAAWAQAGGDTDPYNLSLNYALNGTNLGAPLGQINNTNIPNVNLQPLTSTTSEIGVETRMFNDRFNLDVTLYNRKTRNDIVAATVSLASGYSTALYNVGAISNKGIELLIGGTPFKTKSFSWNTSFNISYNKSEVLSLYQNLTTLRVDQSRYGTSFIDQIVGKPYGQITGFDYKRDASGNIVYSAGGAPQKGNLIVYGSGVAPYAMGFTNTFTYKRISLSTLIDAKFGGYIYSGSKAFAYRFGLAPETLEGRDGGIIGVGVNEQGTPNTVSSTSQNYFGSIHSNIATPTVFKSDFIKLRQIILNYQIPSSLLNKINVKGATIGLVARNVVILMKKTGNLDPESNYNNSNAQGLEYGSAPTTRNIGLNLNIKF
ncbi:SusC/RagA family TonB-linked outer membrane protein [Mucilaginibacter sp. ZT4R22]|uniref:SusC/RagA family TonB-linked outer membrane protein n=1 Tax=Mucilaginibacter pankratovii TaxID=2772110 RepID=A0ABR7WR86_9SPHI|nr:SusC/RagA family TonB-linked outer membrane protein [Mucilaginibacter pankratovii]MBD1363767.1 SusC/RagA family TonB-linked outer membrane protein [Mucilaginibacter pankratovii]